MGCCTLRTQQQPLPFRDQIESRFNCRVADRLRPAAAGAHRPQDQEIADRRRNPDASR